MCQSGIRESTKGRSAVEVTMLGSRGILWAACKKGLISYQCWLSQQCQSQSSSTPLSQHTRTRALVTHIPTHSYAHTTTGLNRSLILCYFIQIVKKGLKTGLIFLTHKEHVGFGKSVILEEVTLSLFYMLTFSNSFQIRFFFCFSLQFSTKIQAILFRTSNSNSAFHLNLAAST